MHAASKAVRKDLQRVLFISYAFPPTGGGGVQRSVKFAKYLPDHGWLPTILTAANPSVPVSDPALLRDVDPQLPIVRARTWEPGYGAKRRLLDHPQGRGGGLRSRLRRQAVRMLQPDPQILWNGSARRAAARRLRREPHRAILVSGPPFSSFLLAARLKHQFRLPLVLDFRDEWTMIHRYLENQQSADSSERRQQRMMLQTLVAADAVITTTEASAAELRRCCQTAGSGAAVQHIYNGFDPPDIADLKGESRSSEKLRIVYTGTLWRLTDVTPLAAAVELVAQRSPEAVDRLELVLAGRRTPAQDAILDRLGRSGISVVRHDYLPHDRSLQLAAGADILCLLLADAPGAERVVPAKLFEYMALRRPVLALVPPGETQRLVEELPAAHVFSPGQSAAVADWLVQELAAHRAGRDDDRPLGAPAITDVARYSRPTLTAQLAGVLDRVAAPRRDRS